VPPDFREWVESPGIPVTPIGPEVRRFAASRTTATQPQTPLTAAQRRQNDGSDRRSTVRDVDFCRARVRRDGRATALQVAARSLAEMLGISYVVFAAYAPVVPLSPHHAPRPLPPVPGQASAHNERQQ
jgi:vancomycin aglycone glucosyltransferase